MAVAIGDERRLGGFTLAGVDVVAVAGSDAVEAAWEALPVDVALLILSPDACQHLRDRLAERPELVWVVLPE